MRVLYKSLVVTTLCVAVSVFMLADVSHAKVSKVKVHVVADLEPCGAAAPTTSPCDPAGTPPAPDAEGRMRRIKEIRKGVIKVDKFKGTVKIPIPASALGIVDEASAENADIRLILSRNGTDFAECLLEFDEIDEDDDDDELQAQFKVHVRIHKGTTQAKKGVCDIDLETSDIQSGVPDSQSGDVATATFVIDPNTRGADVDFLQGTFERH